MITFSERVLLNRYYYDWLERAKVEENLILEDCNLSFTAFLSSNNLLNEEAVHTFCLKIKE